MPTFRWPVRGRVITGFGRKPSGEQNDGINVAVPEGTPIKAAEDGVVAYAGNELKSYGNLVLVRHANGYVTAYAHASEIMVKRGDTVKRGQIIAKAGQTGNVDVAATALRDPQGLDAGRSDAVPRQGAATADCRSAVRSVTTPSRPARSCTYCHATRPEREPRVVAHSSASRAGRRRRPES